MVNCVQRECNYMYFTINTVVGVVQSTENCLVRFATYTYVCALTEYFCHNLHYSSSLLRKK